MPSFRALRSLAASAAVLSLGACFAMEVPRASVLTISTPADADALIPPLVTTLQGKQAVDLLYDFLAEAQAPILTVGDAGFRPQLAERWQWAADSLSVAFTLNERARWHDGAPVTARDVAFSFDLYTDPVVGSIHAGNFEGIDSVSVRDASTAVVWWSQRHPEQFFQLAYNLAIMPEHLLGALPRDSLLQSAFASHPIGSGRYRFAAWHRQQDLMFEADENNYRGAPGTGRLVWVIAADPTSAALSVLSGQADMIESVRGDAFTTAQTSETVRTVEYGSLDYAYMLFNYDRRVNGTPRFFADRAMRHAITQGIDRERVVANGLDSLGRVALGPFTRAVEAVDTTMRQIAFDRAGAARTLDSLGWRLDAADGLRKRSGRPLSFNVLVPASSSTRRKLAVLLQAQLREVGAQLEIETVEPQVFSARLAKGDFDMALNMWHTDPSPSTIRQVWGSPRGSDAAANFGRYSNVVFDAALDSAAITFDPARRQALYRRAYQEIVDDAAAVWLYEPRTFAAMNSRVTPTALRADAWWADLPNWRVDAVPRK